MWSFSCSLVYNFESCCIFLLHRPHISLLVKYFIVVKHWNYPIVVLFRANDAFLLSYKSRGKFFRKIVKLRFDFIYSLNLFYAPKWHPVSSNICVYGKIRIPRNKVTKNERSSSNYRRNFGSRSGFRTEIFSGWLWGFLKVFILTTKF